MAATSAEKGRKASADAHAKRQNGTRRLPASAFTAWFPKGTSRPKIRNSGCCAGKRRSQAGRRSVPALPTSEAMQRKTPYWPVTALLPAV